MDEKGYQDFIKKDDERIDNMSDEEFERLTSEMGFIQIPILSEEELKRAMKDQMKKFDKRPKIDFSKVTYDIEPKTSIDDTNKVYTKMKNSNQNNKID